MSRWVASDRVLLSSTEDGALLLDLEGRLYYRLNQTAALCWTELCRGPQDMGALSAAVASRFDVERDLAAVDIQNLLTELVTLGLVRVENETA